MAPSPSNESRTSSDTREKYPYPTEFNVLEFVPKLLSKENYEDWKKLMRDFIDSHGLIGFIDGTKKSNKDDDYMAWRRSDNLVRRWILETLTEDTRLRVLSFKTAKDLMAKLEEIIDDTKSTLPQLGCYPYPTEFNVLDFVPKLLFEENYEIWKKLMRDFIDSHGLIGFVDGTKKSNKDDDYMAWKRSDDLVRRWILVTLTEDTRLKVLSFKTVKDLMTKLEEIFDATKSTLPQLDNKTKHRQGHYIELQKAAINADWRKAMGVIQRDSDAVRNPINIYRQTALTIAITSASPERRRNSFVRELLTKMTPQDVDLVDKSKRTALHWAAEFNNIEGAKMLVNRKSSALDVRDEDNWTPLHLAALSGHRKMVSYLLKEATGEESVDKFLADPIIGAVLLYCLTRGELYDIALTLLERISDRNLVIRCMNKRNPLVVIAEKSSSFPSGNRFNFWQRLIYSGVPTKSKGIAKHHKGGGGSGDIENQANCYLTVRQRMRFMIWEVAEKLVPHVKGIRKKKERHHHALKLVKFLCTEVAKLNSSEVEEIFRPALRKATHVGIPEIIEQIVMSYPSALYFVDLDGLMTYAILHRQERVFNLIYQIGSSGTAYISARDSFSNNGLHLVARLGPEQQINLKASAAGSVLQMQRELQWFEEVKKISQIGDRELKNSDGMTPAEVFTYTHQDLVKEGERWMKDTATSCTIVAALIATMVFAAAITVPGGNNNENGRPLLSKQNAFIIFGISDALALFSSITSVLMFLLILTSRYAEEDFLSTLPKRLIVGLITLFVSILFTMIAFCAILYLMFGDEKTWIHVPMVALATIPVALFGALQFPLLVEMIRSTYGRGIFGKQSNSVLR